MVFMNKIIKIGITELNNQKIKSVNKIKVVEGKGITGDRHYQDYNDPYNQLTIIEKEDIDHYNIKFNLNIPYLDFRRNIVTEGIRLNNLVGKKIKINDIDLEVIDLCRPCRHLQENLSQENIIKEFLRSGGIRCQILKTGIIKVGDKINLN